MAFRDHFSTQADSYAAARPHYPAALFDHLLALVGASAQVWEAACGSGQATVDLASRFAHVHASEPSAAALARAPRLPNVDWVQASAEHCALPAYSVDLVVVAQALHWFDIECFFAEVRRVLRPGGVLAVWCYQDIELPADLRAAHTPFAARIAPYWPPERALVDQAYAGLRWPFQALPEARFEMRAHWELARLLTYFRSYSATVRCQHAIGTDPVAELSPALAACWGEPGRARELRWPMPLTLRQRAADDRAAGP